MAGSDIHALVDFSGANGWRRLRALVDTGAQLTLVPGQLAASLGAWPTGQTATLCGVHGDCRTLPTAMLRVHFAALGGKGWLFKVAVDANRGEPIIGMDVLGPLGIHIDTRTGHIAIKSEAWETFKTIAGIGAVAGGVGLPRHLGRCETAGQPVYGSEAEALPRTGAPYLWVSLAEAWPVGRPACLGIP